MLDGLLGAGLKKDLIFCELCRDVDGGIFVEILSV